MTLLKHLFGKTISGNLAYPLLKTRIIHGDNREGKKDEIN